MTLNSFLVDILIVRALALERWHKGSNELYLCSPTMDQERMKPVGDFPSLRSVPGVPSVLCTVG